MASVRKRTWMAPSGETKTAWMVDYSDRRGNRLREHFPSKKAADAFRINVEGQIQNGIYRPDASKLTVAQICESFLKHCEGRHQRDERMTRKMLVVYRGHVSNHILHPEHGIGAWKLSQLTARAVGEFRDRLRTAGVSVATTRKILSTLHGVFEYAISQDWVATNAARGVMRRCKSRWIATATYSPAKATSTRWIKSRRGFSPRTPSEHPASSCAIHVPRTRGHDGGQEGNTLVLRGIRWHRTNTRF
jgi:hypothetical protein